MKKPTWETLEVVKRFRDAEGHLAAKLAERSRLNLAAVEIGRQLRTMGRPRYEGTPYSQRDRLHHGWPIRRWSPTKR